MERAAGKSGKEKREREGSPFDQGVSAKTAKRIRSEDDRKGTWGWPEEEEKIENTPISTAFSENSSENRPAGSCSDSGTSSWNASAREDTIAVEDGALIESSGHITHKGGYRPLLGLLEATDPTDMRRGLQDLEEILFLAPEAKLAMLFHNFQRAPAQSGDAKGMQKTVIHSMKRVFALVESKLSSTMTASGIELNTMLCRVLQAVFAAKPSTVNIDLLSIPSVLCHLLISTEDLDLARGSRRRTQDNRRLLFAALQTLLLLSKQGREPMRAIPLSQTLKAIMSFWTHLPDPARRTAAMLIAQLCQHGSGDLEDEDIGALKRLLDGVEDRGDRGIAAHLCSARRSLRRGKRAAAARQMPVAIDVEEEGAGSRRQDRVADVLMVPVSVLVPPSHSRDAPIFIETMFKSRTVRNPTLKPVVSPPAFGFHEYVGTLEIPRQNPARSGTTVYYRYRTFKSGKQECGERPFRMLSVQNMEDGGRVLDDFVDFSDTAEHDADAVLRARFQLFLSEIQDVDNVDRATSRLVSSVSHLLSANVADGRRASKPVVKYTLGSVQGAVAGWVREVGQMQVADGFDLGPECATMGILAVSGRLRFHAFSRPLYLQIVGLKGCWKTVYACLSKPHKAMVDAAIASQVAAAMKRGDCRWMAVSAFLELENDEEYQRALVSFSEADNTHKTFTKSLIRSEKFLSRRERLWILTHAPSVSSMLGQLECPESGLHPYDLAQCISARLKRIDRLQAGRELAACGKDIQKWLRRCEQAPPTLQVDAGEGFCCLLAWILDVSREQDEELFNLVLSVLRLILKICTNTSETRSLKDACSPVHQFVSEWFWRSSPGRTAFSGWGFPGYATSAPDKLNKVIFNNWVPLLKITESIPRLEGGSEWDSMGRLFNTWLEQKLGSTADKCVELCLRILGGDSALPRTVRDAVSRRLVTAVQSAAIRDHGSLFSKLFTFVFAGDQINPTTAALSALLQQSGCAKAAKPETMLSNLLAWPLWQQYLDVEELGRSLDSSATIELLRMRDFREKVRGDLLSQSIPVSLVMQMAKRMERVKVLFDRASWTNVDSAVAMVAAFSRRRRLVTTLVNLCASWNACSMPGLSKVCAVDLRTLKVSDINQLLPLSASDLGDLERLDYAKGSDIFMQKGVELAESRPGTLQTVDEAFRTCIDPVFKAYFALVDQLEDQSASIGAVFSAFRDCARDKVMRELQVMARSRAPDPSKVDDGAMEWCNSTARSIEFASILHHGQNACSAIVRVARCLNLSARLSTHAAFRGLEVSHAEASSFTDKPLRDMASVTHASTKVLESLDEHQIACLEAMCDNQPLVVWLQQRGTLEDFGRQIQILAGCVEKPQDVERISAVHTIHSRIFGLVELMGKETSAEVLHDELMVAMQRLDATGALASNITQCGHDLEWFRALESNAEKGALEDSKNRMDKLLSSAVVLLQGSEVAASLLVHVPGESGEQKLTLEDLMDLRSRVSLLLSPDDHANGAALVHLGRCIAAGERSRSFLETLITQGSLRHCAFARTIACRSVGAMEEMCEELASETRMWDSFVQQQRSQHHLVNHFTMKQLGIIAKSGIFVFEDGIPSGTDDPHTISDDDDDEIVAEEDVEKLVELTGGRYPRKTLVQALVSNNHSFEKAAEVLTSDTASLPSRSTHVIDDDVVELLRVVAADVTKVQVQAMRQQIEAEGREQWLAGPGWVSDVNALLTRLYGQRQIQAALPSREAQMSSPHVHAICMVTVPEGRTMANTVAAIATKHGVPRRTMVCHPSASQESLALFIRRALQPYDHSLGGGPMDVAHDDAMECDAEGNTTGVSGDQNTSFLLAGVHVLDLEVQKDLFRLIKELLHQRSFFPWDNQLVVTCESSCILSGKLAALPQCQQESRTPWHEDSAIDAAALPQVFVFSGPPQSGKTFQISMLAKQRKARLVTVVVHNSCLTSVCISFKHALSVLKASNYTGPVAYHLEVSSSFASDLDLLAYHVAVGGFLESATGHVWHRRQVDTIIVELPAEVSRSTALRSTVLDHFTQQRQSQTPDQLLAWVGEMEGVGSSGPAELHAAILGKDPQTSAHNFDPSVWQRPDFQRGVQLLHLAAIGQIHSNDPCLAKPEGGVAALPGYDAQIRGLPAHSCLRVLIQHMTLLGLPKSWGAFSVFWRFVAHQAEAFLASSFCMRSLADDLPGFRAFVVQRVLDLCKDFSTNLPAATAGAACSADRAAELALVSLNAGKKWAEQRLSYVIAHQDFVSFFNLQVQHPNGAPAHAQDLVLDSNLYAALKANEAEFCPDYSNRSRKKLLRDLHGVLGLKCLDWDPDPTYYLTLDSIKKMMATWLRLQAGIPVIVQGETGCGKTSMIRFLADVVGRHCKICRVHGGTHISDIKQVVDEATILSRKRNHRNERGCIVFFDEINCGPDMGYFKELLCDRRLDGKKVGENLFFIAACNPYRKLPDAVIAKQQAMGLGFHKEDRESLHGIPLRHLVYRVHQLPASLSEFVWDFGDLAEEPERAYIASTLQVQGQLDPTSPSTQCFVEAIVKAHAYIRRVGESGSEFGGAVSVRDYKERAVPVFRFFCNFFTNQETIKDIRAVEQLRASAKVTLLDWDATVQAMIVALYVAYEARLSDKKLREGFRHEVAQALLPLCSESESALAVADQMRLRVQHLQSLLTEELQLQRGIAKNEVLRENVFMMAVCAQLSIPLFVVGKPGTSKSLAKKVISDSMKGPRSTARLFRHFKHLFVCSYQCSPHSKSEDVQRTWNRAEQFLRGKDTSKFASAVVLDEIGLAEDSAQMPLKVLHPLLENPTVAFFGLSNWAIDPAKMNRCVVLARFDPTSEDLVQTAQSIAAECPRLDPLLLPCCSAYLDVHARCQPKENFYGLRDFFGFMRTLVEMPGASEPGREGLSRSELEFCVRACFGGSDKTDDIVHCFLQHMGSLVDSAEDAGAQAPTTPLEIISARLAATEGGRTRGRYLLIQTESPDAVLQMLIHRNILCAAAVDLISGSKFPRDQGFDSICEQLRKVRVGMATQRTLVCSELEHCLEALYDLLNQFFTASLGKQWVDIGLGQDRMQCEVGDGFRLIILANQTQVASFPIPLLNRLEKHHLMVSDSLAPAEQEGVKEVERLVLRILAPRGQHLESLGTAEGQQLVAKLLPGYCADTLPSLVASIGSSLSNPEDGNAHPMLDAVLWAAAPEAILAGHMSSLVSDTYFQAQRHSRLAEYIVKLAEQQRGRGLRSVITTYSSILSLDEVRHEVLEAFRGNACPGHCVEGEPVAVDVRSLDEFRRMGDLELFIREQEVSLSARTSRSGAGVLVLQMSQARNSGPLVGQVRQLIMARLAAQAHANASYHVILILHLSRSPARRELSLLFDSGWHRAHLDSLVSAVPSGHCLLWEAWKRASRSRLLDPANPVLELGSILDKVMPEALGRLRSADSDFQPLSYARGLKRVLQQDDGVRRCVQGHILRLLQQSEEQAPSQGSDRRDSFVTRLALDTGTLQLAGSLEGVVLGSVERAVSLQLVSVLRAVACNGGLEMLNSFADDASGWRRNSWVRVVGSWVDSPTRSHSSIHLPSREAADAATVVESHSRGLGSFTARFPLSHVVFRAVEEYHRSSLPLSGSLLLNHPFFKGLDETCPASAVMEYIHDLTYMSYLPASARTQGDEYAVIIALLRSQMDGQDASVVSMIALAHAALERMHPMTLHVQTLFKELPAAGMALRKHLDSDPNLSLAHAARSLVDCALAETTPMSESFSYIPVAEWSERITRITGVIQDALERAELTDKERMALKKEWQKREILVHFIDAAHVEGQRPTVHDFWTSVIEGSDDKHNLMFDQVIRIWQQPEGGARQQYEGFVVKMLSTLYSNSKDQEQITQLICSILSGQHSHVLPHFLSEGEPGAPSAQARIRLSQSATARFLRPIVNNLLLSCLDQSQSQGRHVRVLEKIVESIPRNQAHSRHDFLLTISSVADELLRPKSDEEVVKILDVNKNSMKEGARVLVTCGLRIALERTCCWLANTQRPACTSLFDRALVACEGGQDSQRCRSFLLRRLVSCHGLQSLRCLENQDRCTWYRQFFEPSFLERRIDYFAAHGASYRKAMELLSRGELMPMNEGATVSALAFVQTITMDVLGLRGPGSKCRRASRHAEQDAVQISAPDRVAELCQHVPFGHSRAKIMFDSISKNCFGGLESGAHRAILTVSQVQTVFETQVHDFVLHAAIAALAGQEYTKTLQALLLNPESPLLTNLPCVDEFGGEDTSEGGGRDQHWLVCSAGHPVPPCRDDSEAQPPCCSCGAPSRVVIEDDAPASRNALRLWLNRGASRSNLTASALCDGSSLPWHAVVHCMTLALLLAGAALCDGASLPALSRALGVESESGQGAGKAATLTTLCRALEDNVHRLSHALSCSVEDAVVLLHAVCKRQIEAAQQEPGSVSGCWASPAQRNAWEDAYNRSIVSPVLSDREGVLARMREDARVFEGCEPLANALRSRDSDPLWHSRPQINIEYCHSCLEATNTSAIELRCLRKVLRRHKSLRLVSNLGHIVSMQQALLERYSGQITLQESRSMTVESVLRGKKFDHAVEKGFACFLDAWSHVRDAAEHLLPPAVLAMVRSVCQEGPSIGGGSTPLSFLLPSYVCEGIVGVAVVLGLSEMQNSFLRELRKPEQAPKAKQVSELCHSDLVSVNEDALMDVVYSCCDVDTDSSSGACSVKFDFDGMDKLMVARFVNGKPSIGCRELPTCTFSSDQVSIAGVLAVLRDRHMATELEDAEWQGVLSHLVSVNSLEQALSTLETVLRFLAITPGLPSERIGTIVRDVLLLDKDALADATSPPFAIHPAKALDLWRRLDLNLALHHLHALDNPASSSGVLNAAHEALDESAKAGLRASLKSMDAGALVAELRELMLVTVWREEDFKLDRTPLKKALQKHLDKKAAHVAGLADSFPEQITLSHLQHAWVIVALQTSSRASAHGDAGRLDRGTRSVSVKGGRDERIDTTQPPPAFAYEAACCTKGEDWEGTAPRWDAGASELEGRSNSQFSFSVQPRLPPGLTCEQQSGRISGRAERAMPRGIYIVSCRSLGGIARSELVLSVRLPSPVPFCYSASGSVEVAVGVQIQPLQPQPRAAQGIPVETEFSTKGDLPRGLSVCTRTGRVTGQLEWEDDYTFQVVARIGPATTSTDLRIVAKSGPPAAFKYQEMVCMKGRNSGPFHPIPLDAGPLSGGGILFECEAPLPAGLTLDPQTGIVRGAWDGTGFSPPAAVSIAVKVSNGRGSQECQLTLQLKPPADVLHELRELLCERLRAGKSGPLSFEMLLDKTRVAASCTLELSNHRPVTVHPNPAAQPGGALYERFVKALETASGKDVQLQLGFHGTFPQNVDPILQQGLDPVSLPYCQGHGKRMLLFALNMDKEGLTCCQEGFIVIHKTEHQLPLLYFTFQ